MNIFITGSSGLIGTELCRNLNQKKFNTYPLHRIENSIDSQSPNWNINIKKGTKDVFADTYIHLAGENIAAKRWNKKQKQKIYNSRIQGTKNLVKNIIASSHQPKTFICASAIGYYGDRGKELLDESSVAGKDFVSKISQDWELATQPLKEHGIRVVNLRFAVILSTKGGVLHKMLLPFKLGLGGALGSGQQMFSWIHIEDAVNAVIFILENTDISGAINISSPKPVSNSVYTRSLGKTLNRPAFMNMPTFICRLLFGEMADELLLSSQQVVPIKLIKHGFKFNHIDIQSALSNLLK